MTLASYDLHRRNTRTTCLSGTLWLACLFLFAGNVQAANVLLHETFLSPTLDSPWYTLPGNGNYSVGDGALTFLQEGFGSAPEPWFSVSLGIAIPFQGLNWELSTSAHYELAWFNSFGASSGAQRPRLIVSFDPEHPFSDALTVDRAIDAWYGTNRLSAWYVSPLGAVESPDFLDPSDQAVVDNKATGDYFYKIRRNAGELSMLYSKDGVNYQTALSTTLANPESTFAQLIFSATTWESVGSVTRWGPLDVVETDVTTATPEPSSVWLMGGAALAFLLRAARRRSFALPRP